MIVVKDIASPATPMPYAARVSRAERYIPVIEGYDERPLILSDDDANLYNIVAGNSKVNDKGSRSLCKIEVSYERALVGRVECGDEVGDSVPDAEDE